MAALDALPRWRQIADELHHRILTGRYSDDFPGELDVAQEFGVSRGTARAALHPLREAGLITAARGKRPRLAQQDPHSQYGAIYSLHDLIIGAGHRHTSTVREQGITTDAEVAARLGLEAEAALFRLERVRYADDEPVAHDVVWAPASIAEPLLDRDFSTGAFYDHLRRDCGVTIDSGTEQTSATRAGDDLAELLGCTADAPVLLIERLGRSAGRTVEYRRSRFLGDQFHTTREFGSGRRAGQAG